MDHCHGNKYYEELSKCYAVILPLENIHVSSGQLVLIQAMMLGKPIIVTQNDTVSDYILDGVNGIVIEKDVDALFDAVTRLENEKFYKLLSQNARNSYEENFSVYSFGMRVGKILVNN